MDDDDFWGEFTQDYSGGTDELFNFDIDPATLRGINFGNLDLEALEESLNEDFWRNQYGMGQEDYEDMLANKFWQEEFGLGADEQPAITITGKREDTTEEDLADAFWKDWYSREGYPTLLTDEEHVRTFPEDTTEEDLKSQFWGSLLLGSGAAAATRDPYEVDQQTSRDETNALTTSTGGVQGIVNEVKKALANKNMQSALGLLGGLMGLNLNKPRPAGYQGGIPKYTATRGTPRSPTEGGRRPGGANIGPLTGGITYTKTGKDLGAAQGGLMGLAAGGAARPARFLAGGTDGMADKIQTDIDGKQPARLSHGEFVIPADVVSHLGNGNSDAGANVLYDMMAKVRKARTGNPKQGKQINPRKFTPV